MKLFPCASVVQTSFVVVHLVRLAWLPMNRVGNALQRLTQSVQSSAQYDQFSSVLNLHITPSTHPSGAISPKATGEVEKEKKVEKYKKNCKFRNMGLFASRPCASRIETTPQLLRRVKETSSRRKRQNVASPWSVKFNVHSQLHSKLKLTGSETSSANRVQGTMQCSI